MPTDLPLSMVISQVLQHTPVWAWAILFIITLLGLRQVGHHVVTSRRLVFAAVALGAYSLWGAVRAFGPQAEVLAAWVAGVALSVAAGPWLALPGQAQYQGAGRYAVHGSPWPLLTMWAIFGIRYVSTVALLMHPAWAHDTVVSAAMPLVYGALSGLFLARALRILRSAPTAATLSLA